MLSRQTLRSERIGALPILNHFIERLRLEQWLDEYLPPEDKRVKVPAAKALLVMLVESLLERQLRQAMDREEPSKKQRLEQDREDFLAKATALFERIKLDVDTFDEPIFIGFRRSGAGSIYFGPDAAYHFNSHDQLRRAYVGGCSTRLKNNDWFRLSAGVPAARFNSSGMS